MLKFEKLDDLYHGYYYISYAIHLLELITIIMLKSYIKRKRKTAFCTDNRESLSIITKNIPEEVQFEMSAKLSLSKYLER